MCWCWAGSTATRHERTVRNIASRRLASSRNRFQQALGLNLAVKLKTVDKLERYFNGVLIEARWTGNAGRSLRLSARAAAVAVSSVAHVRLPHLLNMKPTKIITKVSATAASPTFART